tara:strand:+ start:9575 stop:10750 length:1176 start_codon:yes stop_codon:yes gene_type:complete
MPSRTELSPEQEQIYMEAPLDGSVVIIGAPGTGKTVLAVFRCHLLNRLKEKFQLVMYNKVLVRYTANAMGDNQLTGNVSTLHSWVYKWWQSAKLGYVRPKPGFEIDFQRMIRLIGEQKVANPRGFDWGHLIVDEGQDFSRDFYLLLNIVAAKGRTHGGKYALTVLADENQRLDEKSNSTIAEILQLVGVAHPYILTKNFRNTFEIARLAAEFYTGARTEIAELPEERRGGLPVVRAFDTMDNEARHIARYARLNDDQAIGVFVKTHQIRRSMMVKLRELLADSGIYLQSYESGTDQSSDAGQLSFNKSGSITLLCDASCKGLEFDAVFIPQMQAHNLDGIAEDFMKMRLYVMCSRARQHLEFSWTDCDGDPEIARLLPSRDKAILDWREKT